MKKVTVLGGGTGTYVVLTGLRKYQDLDLGVIVTMMDSGGSTGRLRDQLGVLPPGDLRQSLVALSDAPELWRKLFLYRFENGDLAGHNFGNIFLSALEKVSSSYDEVVQEAEYVLKTRGHVIPVTYEKTHLAVEYENGIILKGEGNIDTNHAEKSRIKKAFLEPKVKASLRALQRIAESDTIIIGPGDLYSSIIPILLVDGIKEAIQSSNATVIYNMNLMTKSGQTTAYKASDHIIDLSHYLGKQLNHVVMHNGQIPSDMIEWYQREGEQIVVNDLAQQLPQQHVIQTDLIDTNHFEKSKSDRLFRSILRHNPDKLSACLVELL